MKDEYPEYRVVDGMAALLKLAPQTPWGVTWNGGVALTRNDYMHHLSALPG